MSKGNQVSMIVAATKVPIVTTTATAIYRNTDNKVATLKGAIFSNVTAAKVSLKLYDSDNTDSEGNQTAATWILPQIYIDAYDTLILTKDDCDALGLTFRWGIVGIASAATPIEAYVSVEEE